MKKLKFTWIVLLILTTINNYSQQKPQAAKIKITGKVIDKVSKQPLEYATITITSGESTKAIGGGITNPKGEFDVDITPGTYNIKIEFISFKPIIIKERKISEKTNLGQIAL